MHLNSIIFTFRVWYDYQNNQNSIFVNKYIYQNLFNLIRNVTRILKDKIMADNTSQIILHKITPSVD